MTKVVPVKMSDDLYERLQQVAEKVGEADSTIIRLVLRAGLAQIERDKFQVFKFDDAFPAAGEKTSVGAGGSFTGSTRIPAEALPDVSIAARVNEAPPAKPQRKKTSGPRARSTRGIHRVIERERPKS